MEPVVTGTRVTTLVSFSVSRLTITSRVADSASGARLRVEGGINGKLEKVGAPVGTVVCVEDLFYNVPARKKFLRSEQTELAHIASLVTHYSLAHPDKTFLLRGAAGELLRRHPDVLLGLTPQLHLGHVLYGRKSLADIMVDGPQGIRIIPASSGLQEVVLLYPGAIARDSATAADNREVALTANSVDV